VAASGTNNRVMTSPDGITWQTRDTTGKDNNWRDVEWGGAPGAEKFVAIANTSTAGANTRAMTSPDGITWTLQTTPSPELSWQALAWGAGVFTAVGSSGTGTRAMTSPDGIT